ncbi:MAG: metal ABC transporter solute-binding protein, Zn/Mn family [Bradymonadaceae bacterium]
MRILTSILCLVLILGLGCKNEVPRDEDERPLIVATTTMLEDMVRELGGDAVQVRGIMSAGADPHIYQPRPGDAKMIASSQMVVMSGLYLEGWMENLVRHAGGERPVVVAGERIDPIRMKDSPGGVDPHFWFDLEAYGVAARTVGEAMLELVGADTERGQEVQLRLDEYTATLEALHLWVNDRLRTIPEDHRVLVTSHDAFNYFGRAYDIDVEAIQGISTEQEASQRDVANMIELVRKREAPAVFVETSVNPALIRQVARETGAAVAGPLYSDSIGPKDSAASTFVSTVTENVRMIVEALGGQYSPFVHEDMRQRAHE